MLSLPLFIRYKPAILGKVSADHSHCSWRLAKALQSKNDKVNSTFGAVPEGAVVCHQSLLSWLGDLDVKPINCLQEGSCSGDHLIEVTGLYLAKK